jgi:hypothetical protein
MNMAGKKSLKLTKPEGIHHIELPIEGSALKAGRLEFVVSDWKS